MSTFSGLMAGGFDKRASRPARVPSVVEQARKLMIKSAENNDMADPSRRVWLFWNPTRAKWELSDQYEEVNKILRFGPEENRWFSDDLLGKNRKRITEEQALEIARKFFS